jgi:hypothetical protein
MNRLQKSLAVSIILASTLAIPFAPRVGRMSMRRGARMCCGTRGRNVRGPFLRVVHQGEIAS